MGLGMTQSGARMPRNMLQRGKKAKRSMVVTLRQRVDEENENSVSWVEACEQSMTDYSLSPCLTCFSQSQGFFKLMLVLDYDEEDDGFAFSRTRSKKSKAEPPKRPEPITEVLQEEKVGVALTKKPRKKSVDLQSAVLLEIPVKEKRRRSPRNSADHQTTADPPPLHVKKKRVKDNKTSKRHTNESMQSGPLASLQDRELPKATERHEISWDATKITLPFADTPIIRRNKEMRDNRRSSLGMRGRRASSLIDSGKSNGDFVFCRT